MQDEINPYSLDSDDYMQEEKSIQEREERFFPNEEPDVKEIINFIKNNDRNLKITNNDVVRILDTVEKESKLLDTAKKYDLPLSYMFKDEKGEVVALNENIDIPFLSEKTEEKILNSLYDTVEGVIKNAIKNKL